MKKSIKTAIGALAFLAIVGLSSCSITLVEVTNNPVGDTKYTQSAGLFFNTDVDYSLSTAAKKGDIDKIGVIELRYGIFKNSTTISGN